MSKHRAFLSHTSKDSEFVIQVAQYLNKGMDVFYYEDSHADQYGNFIDLLNEELKKATVMIFFIGENLGRYQKKEIKATIQRLITPRVHLVCLGTNIDEIVEEYFGLIPPDLVWPVGAQPNNNSQREVVNTAREIYTQLNVEWVPRDGLPWDPHLFSYEKDIIAFFKNKNRLGEDLYNYQEPNPELAEMRRKLLDGCPSAWPKTEYWENTLQDYGKWPGIAAWRTGSYNSRLKGVGQFRSGMVVAAALSAYHTREQVPTLDNCMIRQGFCLIEAGPRELLYFPPRTNNNQLKVAIVVSGGIAPGINAVIDGIVQRHWKYAIDQAQTGGLTVYGVKNGFRAFERGGTEAIRDSLVKLNPEFTSKHANEGGSMLGISRMDDLIQTVKPRDRLDALEAIIGALRHEQIDILYVIGGDGSMKAAHALWSVSRSNPKNRPLSVVAIPKTMDNDILWVWQAFGFLSAVEKAREVIEHLHTEVSSNPRLGIIQLFGSDSGFVVSHSVLASPTGHCDVALIPEVPFSMKKLAMWIKKKMCDRANRNIGHRIPHGLIVMAETAIPLDAMLYAAPWKKWDGEPKFCIGLSPDEKKAILEFHKLRRAKRRIQGQTSDFLRTAGLKIIKEVLPELLKDPELLKAKGVVVDNCEGVNIDWDKLRVLTNEPRHLLRSISPSCSDIIFGQRMGMLAVDNAMAGYTDFMISQWLTEYVLVPLKLVVLGRKRIPPGGIFWRSVLAKTGQPEDMVSPTLF